MRRDRAKAEDYARRHGVPRWYDDADALIHDDEVDAVYIATPPDSHRDYAVRVLAAGKPVYVEKPMARTTAECEEMLAAAERAGLPLFVAYYRRAMPRFGTVQQLLHDGAVGQVQAVSVRNSQPAVIDDGADVPWRVRPEISGGGHFVDLASHTLDLLDHLLDPCRMDSSVLHESDQRQPGNLSSHRIEPREDDRFRRIIHNHLDAGNRLKRANIATFASDDAALHLV